MKSCAEDYSVTTFMERKSTTRGSTVGDVNTLAILAQCCTVYSVLVAKPSSHAGLTTRVELLGYLVNCFCIVVVSGATRVVEVCPSHW